MGATQITALIVLMVIGMLALFGGCEQGKKIVYVCNCEERASAKRIRQ